MFSDNHETGQHNSDDSIVNFHCHENLKSLYVVVFPCVPYHTDLHYFRFFTDGYQTRLLPQYTGRIVLLPCLSICCFSFLLPLWPCYFSRILLLIFAAFVYSACCFLSYCCLMLRGLACAAVCFLISTPLLLDTLDVKIRYETCYYVQRSISPIWQDSAELVTVVKLQELILSFKTYTSFLHCNYVKVLMNMAYERLLTVQSVNEIGMLKVNNNECNQI